MKVAVIGAGFSGMLAAYELKKAGAYVTVYEKEEYIGGHCKTLVGSAQVTELGCAAVFSPAMKKLLIELKVDYKERITYRNFLDGDYKVCEHIPAQQIPQLLDEVERLKTLLLRYQDALAGLDYGTVPPELTQSLDQFLQNHQLDTLRRAIAPHLSSFGFGSMDAIQAYYAFKVFSIDTIHTLIEGRKLFFIKEGMSRLIAKMSENITDIRFALEILRIEDTDDGVRVDTPYGTDIFDHVLVTAPLPPGIIQNPVYDDAMQRITTHPFVTCAFQVLNKHLSTTYYVKNLGQQGRIQFFHTRRKNHQTVLTAYAYGQISRELIGDMARDLEQSGIEIKHLITAKQWNIFPHVKDLTETFYTDLLSERRHSRIALIGSLVSKPELGALYRSIRQTVGEIVGG